MRIANVSCVMLDPWEEVSVERQEMERTISYSYYNCFRQ